jgi:hypothetical protein
MVFCRKKKSKEREKKMGGGGGVVERVLLGEILIIIYKTLFSPKRQIKKRKKTLQIPIIKVFFY